MKGLLHELASHKEESSVYAETSLKWAKEMFINTPKVTPAKLKGKIPMKQIVIDVNNNLFMYHFHSGRIMYLYMGSAAPLTKS